MLKGVLFDLGSTLQEFRHENWELLTTEHSRSLYRYIEERGHAHRVPPLDEFIEIIDALTQAHWTAMRRDMQGRPITERLGTFLLEHGILDLHADEYLLPWYRVMNDHVYIKPDVKPTLELLKKGGLKLGLVSNTLWPAAAHDPDLQRFGIYDLLDCRLYSCEVGWEKPAPQIFHAALEALGLQPHETAFVGDFLRYDVAGAHGVGMKGVWKRVEGRPQELDDYTIVPDATITSIEELPGALRELYG